MNITTSIIDSVTYIAISEQFDLSLHTEFRMAYKNTPKGSEFVVNMQRVIHMDSSALGMLLLLREHAGGDSSKIKLTGCCPDIKQILLVANFQNLFNIA